MRAKVSYLLDSFNSSGYYGSRRQRNSIKLNYMSGATSKSVLQEQDEVRCLKPTLVRPDPNSSGCVMKTIR